MNTQQRTESRQQYQKIKRIIKLNTGGPDTPMRAGMRVAEVGTIARHNDLEPGVATNKLRALRNNGDVLRYRDSEGAWRYCLRTEAGLEAVVGQSNKCDEPPADVIGDRIVPALREVCGDE